MNVGINGVSGRGGRWMFSQRGRSRRNTVSAGRGPGLLCLSTHRPGGQRLKHAPLPDPCFLLRPFSTRCHSDPNFHRSQVQVPSLTPSNFPSMWAHIEHSDRFVLVVDIVNLMQKRGTLGENKLKQV